MRNFFSTIVFSILIFNFAPANTVQAQKIGHLDSEYILEQMPEYDEKIKELEELASTYDKEVRILYGEVEKMRAALRADEVLLTAAMKADRQKAIEAKEQEALKRYTELFGNDGLYYKKVDELVKPLREKVSLAAEAVAKRHGLDYILDKASSIGIIYSNPTHDYTEFVMEELGLKIERN